MFDNSSSGSEGEEEVALVELVTSVEKKLQNIDNGIEEIQSSIKDFVDMGGDLISSSIKGLIVTLRERIKHECETIGIHLEDVRDAMDEAKNFAHPDQNKIAQLQKENENLKNDYFVTVQRLEQGEGQGLKKKSKAQEKREQSQVRRETENSKGNHHKRYFSLMEVYNKIQSVNENSSDSETDDEDMKLAEQKLTVTMESASHHCDVIKDVLREMLSEIGLVSEAEQSLCSSVSETIKGSIDRIQFALDNLYETGIDEHEKVSQLSKEMEKKKRGN